MGDRETREAQAMLLLAESHLARRLKAAVRLWAREQRSTSLADVVARATAVGSLDSWHDGVAAGEITITWLASQLGADIPVYQIDEPALFITRRAAAVGLSFDVAFNKAFQEIQAAGSSANPTNSTLSKLGFRLDRIAATESAIQFTTARRGVVEASVDRATTFSSRAEKGHLIQVWNAALDACERCRAMDGKKTELGGTYDGQLPGFIHANCRCVDSFEIE
jgi:hypothetical protein